MTGTREWLVNEAYPDGRNLAARRSIYTFRTPQCDLPALAVQQLRDVRGLVVDVGCGDGVYVRALRAARPDLSVLGLDLSPGMLAATGPPVLLADGQALFTLEDGELMARTHFERVRRLNFTGWVTLTDPEPLVRFVESTMPYFRGVPVGPVLDRVKERTAAVIGAAGAFRFRSHTGFLVCG
jgi:SAM-dependent methyltransferase